VLIESPDPSGRLLAARSSVAEPTVKKTVLIRLHDAGQVPKSVEMPIDFD
jgi:hypothetical protein